MSGLRLGVDVGGTFTDFVLLSSAGDVKLHKRLSTPADPSMGILAGLAELTSKHGIAPAQITALVHGTTVVANALIERKGARTGLVTTDGFRDVLEIGREVRYDIYDLQIENPEPLAPRYLRLGIVERTLADGSVRKQPAPSDIRAAAARLAAEGVKTIAVCLINSHRNAANEQAVGSLLRSEFPDIHVTLSSEIAPEIREYERMSTAVANAYVHPLVDRYLHELVRKLADTGFAGSFYVMLSQGGLATADFVRKRPISIVESGPAAGVQATCFLTRPIGVERVISFDMGGTTAKVCVIDDGEPDYTADTEVARIHRFKKGSGLPLKVPAVELIEIGAGGGSIAWLDDMSLLRVGPESAGASPGPACYGLGGERPTVTDADLLLGYLNPDNFLGGEMRLDVERARAAVDRHVAAPLGLATTAAAAGIVGVANENMAVAARLHVAERGRDPQKYSLVAFGGAGPVHALGLARALRLRTVLLPASAGNLSALGFLVAPVTVSTTRSYVAWLDQIDWKRLASLFADMRSEADATMSDVGIPQDAVQRRITAEMRYVGQGYEVDVPLTEDELRTGDATALKVRFEDAYRTLFGMTLTDVPIEAINWRMTSKGPTPDVHLRRIAAAPSASAASARTGERDIYIPERREFQRAPVYDRYRLSPGMVFEGPAIVEERESTVVVNGPGRVSIDEYGNIRIDLPAESEQADSATP
jgi:N-methylhydantoinase A